MSCGGESSMKKNPYRQALDALEKQYSIENGTAELSAEQEKRYHRLIKTMDFAQASEANHEPVKRRIHQTNRSTWKRAAIILLCVSTLVLSTAPAAEAFRLRFQKLFSWEKPGYSLVRPADNDSMSQWNNYFYFERLPDGYVQTYAEDIGQCRTIVYEQGDNSIILEQNNAQFTVLMDNEETTSEDVTVLGSSGKYYNNAEDAISTLIFLQGDLMITIYTNGPERLQGEDLIHCVDQNLIYHK